MYYHIKYCFLILALSALICEHQSSQVSGKRNLNDANNQRDMMIEQFKFALINDSDQLVTLQKAFLLPRPNDRGLCLKTIVTVKGRVTDNSGYDASSVCSVIDEKTGTVCTYLSTEGFELSPATKVTLADFLRSLDIVEMLATLDPSFYYLTRSLLSYGSTTSVLYHDHDINYTYPTYRSYELSVTIDKIEFNSLSWIQDDVTDAVQIALSWVS